MTQRSIYADVDEVIDRWVKASGSSLFTEWANEPARFFYVPGLWHFECFQVSISPPSPAGITVLAYSVDTNDGQEMEKTWQGAPTELDAMLASAMREIEQWKYRRLTKPVSYFSNVRYDLSTPAGRFKAKWDYVWQDHAFLRRWFMNAHWLGPDLVRTNQPSPRQLAYWKSRGIETVINLRGARDEAYHALEVDACRRLGLTLIDAPLDSRDVPTPDRVHRARGLFRTIAYPVLIHCKSGADRAGLMAVLYRHFHLGEPISVAIAELSKKYLHSREGLTGVLDFYLEKYVDEIEPTGMSFIDWIDSPGYDPKAIRAEFKAGWWGTLLTEKLLKRE